MGFNTFNWSFFWVGLKLDARQVHLQTSGGLRQSTTAGNTKQFDTETNIHFALKSQIQKKKNKTDSDWLAESPVRLTVQTVSCNSQSYYCDRQVHCVLPHYYNTTMTTCYVYIYTSTLVLILKQSSTSKALLTVTSTENRSKGQRRLACLR